MAPLLTLIAYLVAGALAIGYACETGLPSWRRVTACVLSMVLAVGSGHLLTSAHPVVAYVAGIPALLALGMIMIIPERETRPPATPRRRASDRVGPGSATGRWQIDGRATGRRPPAPALTDARGNHYQNPVTEITTEITYGAQAVQVTHAPAVTRAAGSAPGRRRWAAGGGLAARRHHSRRGGPRSVSWIARCKYH